MASKACLRHLRQLAGLSPRQELIRNGGICAAGSRRSMATVSDTPNNPYTVTIDQTPNIKDPAKVLATVYSFPDMEPKRFVYYPKTHLYLPLRRDILHKAVVYEGDMTRQGTASTRWRDDVHGSHRKLYQQKGMGKARVGDKQSPIRRGGGIAFGPKPRDFATKLNKKVYDLAWRTALSYRYRRGELVLVDAIRDLEVSGTHWIKQVFSANRWGQEHKRSLLVTSRQSEDNEQLFEEMKRAGEQGRLLELEDVDVKDLLETGRVIIEHKALKRMLREHSSDLVATVQQVAPVAPVAQEERPALD